MPRKAKDRGLSQRPKSAQEPLPIADSNVSELPSPATAAPVEEVVVVSVNSEIRHIVPAPEPLPPGLAPTGPDTVFTGELLKQIRESQRITLKEIAERTRLSVHSLAALENERYEDLPNARVYVRGFVRCLAAEIGLDRDHVSRTYVPRWEAWFAALNTR